ncbi:MAG: hypothetical protein ACR2RV_29875, partial [Verrucomicrobiales bacterium]
MDLDHAKFTSSRAPKSTPYGAARSRSSQLILFLYLLAWPIAILVAPLAWIYHPLAGVLFGLVIGLHINTQLGFFYHELWHQSFFKSPR